MNLKTIHGKGLPLAIESFQKKILPWDRAVTDKVESTGFQSSWSKWNLYSHQIY